MCAGAICFNGTTYSMCCIWLAKNDLDNEVRTLQLLGRIPYCLIINLVSSRKQPCLPSGYVPSQLYTHTFKHKTNSLSFHNMFQCSHCYTRTVLCQKCHKNMCPVPHRVHQSTEGTEHKEPSPSLPFPHY